MSNVFTAVVNLCRDPEPLTLGEREVMKLRLADNTSKKNETLFFGAIVSGYDAETAKRLATGDQIVISGQLTATSYKAKKAGKNVKKGDTVHAMEMPFAKIVQVVKSPTFSGETEATAAPDDAPGITPSDAVDDPLADLG